MCNLVIIPARGGSTRLKDKNIYPLGGKPLIKWTIDAAVGSEMFSEIIVSSDSDSILNVAKKSDVTLHKRDSIYATTEIPVLDLIIHLADKYKHYYKTITYLLPTCPFRTSHHIRQAFEYGDKVDSVVSVVDYQEPIQLAGTVNGDVFKPYFDNLITGKTNSLFMNKYYRPNGGLYMTNIDFLLEKKNFFKGIVGTVIMNKEESHDINDLLDMKIAKLIINGGYY